MKKILSTLAVLAFALGFASADVKFSFYNKLYEEDPFVEHYENGRNDDGDSETVSDFMGILNRMYFEVFTDRVDAMIKADVRFDDNDDNDHYYLDGRLKDWYIEFRPVEIATLSLHTGIFSDGSYLPVYDDNINAGNIGSDGLTFTLRPVEGLRLGVTAPFSMDSDWGDKNYFNGDDEGENDKFDFGIGAIYGQELFQIGFSVQDIADSDERQIGAYINLPTLFGASEAVTVGAGFAHSEKYRAVVADEDTISLGNIGDDVLYKNLLSAYATLEFEKFGLSAEIAYNLSDDNSDDNAESIYDLYSAASLSFGLADKLTASVTGKILSDLKSETSTNKTILFGAFGLEYEANEKNTLGCEFNIATKDKDWSIAIPVFWKYHFEK